MIYVSVAIVIKFISSHSCIESAVWSTICIKSVGLAAMDRGIITDSDYLLSVFVVNI